MSRLVSRKKSKFPSKIKAWKNLEKSGIPQTRIIKPQHTKSKWQWKVRSKGQRKKFK